MNFAEQYKSPHWQKKRLEVLEYYSFTCVKCESTEKTLHVHHPFYKKDRKIWEYETTALIALCDECHKKEHDLDDEIKSCFGDMVSFGIYEKERALGYIKALTEGPWTKLNSYEEIDGFLDCFGIIGDLRKPLIDLIIDNNGYIDGLFNGETYLSDLSDLISKEFKPKKGLFQRAIQATKKRLEFFKMR